MTATLTSRHAAAGVPITNPAAAAAATTDTDTDTDIAKTKHEPINNNHATNKQSNSNKTPSISQAFNVLSNFRALLVRPASRGPSSSSSSVDLSCLDGYRAWLVLWMFCFHGIFYIGAYFTAADHIALAGSPWMNWAKLGFLPVDGFFVLTGFLLAYPLFLSYRNAMSKKTDTPSEPPPFSYRDFWYRRMTRMFPLYIIYIFMASWFLNTWEGYTQVQWIRNSRTVSLYAHIQHFMNHLTLQPTDWMQSECQPQYLIHNLFFTNHIVVSCHGHTWSLGVQFQFYLWFPLIYSWLGRSPHRTRIACYAVIIWSILFRMYSFFHVRQFPLNHAQGLIQQFVYYSSALSRISPIIVGVLLAYYSIFSSIVPWLQKHVHLRNIITSLVLGISAVQMYASSFDHGDIAIPPAGSVIRLSQSLAPIAWPTPSTLSSFIPILPHLIYYMFFSVGSILSACIFAWIMLLTIYQLGYIGTFLNRIMSASIWFPISQLSYQIFMYHPSFMQRVFPLFSLALNSTIPSDIPSVAYYIGVMFLIVLAWSIFSFVMIERPLDTLLRTHVSPRLATAVVKYCWFAVGWAVIVQPLLFLYIMTIQPTPDAPIDFDVYTATFPGSDCYQRTYGNVTG